MFEKRSDLVRFLALVEEGGVGAAAERLDMTQPGVSRFLARIEREFGAALFERTTTGVRPTALGAALAEPARTILRGFDAARDTAGAARAGRAGPFRITACPVWLDAVLPHAIARFRNACPGVELRLDAATRAEGLRLLAAGAADLHCGGVDTGERLPAFLRRERFVDLTAGIVAARRHPLLARAASLDDSARRRRRTIHSALRITIPSSSSVVRSIGATSSTAPAGSTVTATVFFRLALRRMVYGSSVPPQATAEVSVAVIDRRAPSPGPRRADRAVDGSFPARGDENLRRLEQLRRALALPAGAGLLVAVELLDRFGLPGVADDGALALDDRERQAVDEYHDVGDDVLLRPQHLVLAGDEPLVAVRLVEVEEPDRVALAPVTTVLLQGDAVGERGVEGLAGLGEAGSGDLRHGLDGPGEVGVGEPGVQALEGGGEAVVRMGSLKLGRSGSRSSDGM